VNRQTDMLIAIFHTTVGGKVINVKFTMVAKAAKQVIESTGMKTAVERDFACGMLYYFK